MKTALLTCLLLLSTLLGRGQINDFAPVGAEWNFYSSSWGIGSIGRMYRSVKDTTINHKMCKAVESEHDSDTLIFYTDHSKNSVYKYESSIDSFLLYMDFNLEQGDTLKKEVILDNELKIVAMKVDTVVTINFNGNHYPVIIGTDDVIVNINNSIPIWNDRTFYSCSEDTLFAYFNRIGKPYYSKLFGYPGGIIPYGDHTETRQLLYSYRHQENERITGCGIVGINTKIKSDVIISYNNSTRQIKINKFIPSRQIEVIDLIGRKYRLNQTKSTTEISTFDSSSLFPGIYIVKIQNFNKKIYVY
jgi:hypothetical protein